jgi:hypothetical protein
MFLKYKKYNFQCKVFLFDSLTSAPDTLVSMTLLNIPKLKSA